MNSRKYVSSDTIDFQDAAPKIVGRGKKTCFKCGYLQPAGNKNCKNPNGCDHIFVKKVTEKPPEMPVAVAIVSEPAPIVDAVSVVNECLPVGYTYLGSLKNPMVNFVVHVATKPNSKEAITAKSLRELLDTCWGDVHTQM